MTFHLESSLLFKYCDERGLDILESLRLKVTPPVEFNDPFEFMPKVEMQFSKDSLAKEMSSIRLIKRFWKEVPNDLDFETFRGACLKQLHRRGNLSKTLRELEKLATREKEGIVEFMSRRYAIACYSEFPEDILMWAHYAKSHHGLAVGFNANHAFFKNGSNTMPVIYRSERVDAAYNRGLNIREPAIALFRSKSSHWSYEREWRQFFRLSKSAKVKTDSGGTAYFQKLPPRAIAEVILGNRSLPALERHVRKVLSSPRLRHIRLRRAVLHERDYRLTIIDA